MIFFPSRLSWRMRTVGFELRLGMRAMYMGTTRYRIIPENHLSTVGYDTKSTGLGWKFSLVAGEAASRFKEAQRPLRQA